ncbi:hypothetical protein PLEOSDRAFT_1090993 [Pleurotus ostreatus PC15]|uniref:Uncharacterized protein n=1 Tax=Pleurotus ostreatus (strain PC15) TaxID=1137138 RepID=A0A067N6G2_PLEO1|nr:hypothetical protein PLEOSDRAFT_1090993 [Pleurotus ostreatus PC15]
MDSIVQVILQQPYETSTCSSNPWALNSKTGKILFSSYSISSSVGRGIPIVESYKINREHLLLVRGNTIHQPSCGPRPTVEPGLASPSDDTPCWTRSFCGLSH